MASCPAWPHLFYSRAGAGDRGANSGHRDPPQIVISLTGAARLLTFVTGAIAFGIIAVSFVGFSRRIATARSVTAFVDDAFGPPAGFVAGWKLILNFGTKER